MTAKVSELYPQTRLSAIETANCHWEDAAKGPDDNRLRVRGSARDTRTAASVKDHPTQTAAPNLELAVLPSVADHRKLSRTICGLCVFDQPDFTR
jgi:hypothetical protein